MHGDVEVIAHPCAYGPLAGASQACRLSQLKIERLAQARGERLSEGGAVDGSTEVIGTDPLSQRHRAELARGPFGSSGLARVDAARIDRKAEAEGEVAGPVVVNPPRVQPGEVKPGERRRP